MSPRWSGSLFGFACSATMTARKIGHYRSSYARFGGSASRTVSRSSGALDQGGGLDDDVVDVATSFQALVEVALSSRALAEQFHEIDDLEARPSPTSRFAMAGMVDVANLLTPASATAAARLDQFALELGNCPGCWPGSHARSRSRQLGAGTDRQQLLYGIDDAGGRPLVQAMRLSTRRSSAGEPIACRQGRSGTGSRFAPNCD